MKITLENFRCWENKSVEIGDESLILLSGPSGTGKSTILNAINFVITGAGRNILTYGKTTCKVTLEIADIKIIRSRRPNRLIFIRKGKEYEDDTGQELINRIFGSLYSQCSYIQQDNHNTFIYMSPTDKLEFLESFAFHSVDIASKKENIREYLRERQDDHKVAHNILVSTKEIFESMEVPENVKFPAKCEKDDQESVIEKYQKLEKDLLKKHQKLEKDINQDKLDRQRHYLLESQIEPMRQKLKEYLEQEIFISGKCQNFETLDQEIYECEEKLKKQKEQKERKELVEKIQEMKLSLEEMTKNEDSERKEKLKNLSKELWISDNETITRESIESLESYLTDIIYLDKNNREKPLREDIENTERKIKKMEKEIEELGQKYNMAVVSSKVYKCPECHLHIRFEKDKLIKHDQEVLREDPITIESNLNKYKLELQKLRKSLQNSEKEWQLAQNTYEKCQEIIESYEEIRDSEDIKKDLEEFQKYLKENLVRELEIKNLKDLGESKSIREYRKKMENLQQKIQKYEENEILEEDNDNSNIGERYQKLLVQREEYRHLSMKIKELKKNIIGLRMEIEEIEKKLQNIELKEIEELKSEFIRISEKLQKTQEINIKIEKYQMNSKIRKNWEEVKEKYEKSKEKETKCGKKLESIMSLRDKVLKAESIYLQALIQKLSINTNKILENFFLDNPMTIEFKTFKQGKKDTKSQINLDIWYKNHEIDLLELSGGERDRLDLAVTIALSQTFESPLLMLDECISSLDTENFNNVLEYLKDNNAFAHVLLVSHQANEGIFDSVINL